MASYLVLDLETGFKEVHKRTGNPWYNEIVALGLKAQDDEEAEVHYLYRTKIQNGFKFLQEARYNILVGHNIKYDLLYLWKYEQLQQWILEGGRIFDTQLAEYILTGQQYKYPALREIAVKKYGCKEREKKMEKYWDQRIDTKDIPRELVLEDVQNDVLDTEQVMLQQVQQLKKEGQYTLAMEMMEGLLATIEMEYNGIYIDQHKMRTNKMLVESEIQGILGDLSTLAERYWK